MSLFGSSGVRGRVGERVTPDLFLRLGAAVGSRYDDVVVGRDPRTSGPLLAAAFEAGAMASGGDVVDIGPASTPTVAFAARHHACGASITASHNPPEDNGLKLWNPDGSSFLGPQRAAVERALDAGAFRRVTWKEVGQLRHLDGVVDSHVEAIRRAVGRADLKVVVDCGCGATGDATPALLRRMGCSVIALNARPDGHFPARDPEPTAESTRMLQRTVTRTKADLGLAHDGDGDRLVAVDQEGRFVGGNLLLPVFAKGAKSAVVPVDAPMAVDEVVRGRVWRCRVGDAYVAEALKRKRAAFGGEPSGTWIFPEWSYCPDGVYAAARLVRMVARKPLSAWLASVPSYPSLRSTFRYPAARRTQMEKRLDAALRSVPDAKVARLDGWRFAFEDGWGLVRLSGTEPKVRVNAEARTEKRARAIHRFLMKRVKGAMG